MPVAERPQRRIWRRCIRQRPLAAFASICALLQALPAEANDRRVVFPHGATAVTLKGKISGRGDNSYVLTAAAGQVLQVLLSPSHRSCAMNVFAPGLTTAAHIGTVSGNEFGSSPTRAGNYRIQVYQVRSAARRGESCRYSLSVELTGHPSALSPKASDEHLVRRCRAEAARMYGVRPAQISARGVVAASGTIRIDGVANKGKEGRKKLRCLFNADRTFSHIMALTPDGE